ncbi:MAG: glycosyltransferase family 9 protein, partial [Bacteroidota bacterium]
QERRFFFIGSRDEHEYVQRHLDSKPDLQKHVTNCAGVLSIGELAALFEQSSLLLTNDSGPMHIAASLGTPVVALFGPESPQFYGPRTNARMIYKALNCSPCLNMYNAKLFHCPYNARCMSEISTAEVMHAIDEVLVPLQSGVS